MTEEQWPARVFDPARPGGGGSGFLIAPDLVLTVAHVVEGATAVTVQFPAARPQLGDLPAAVEFTGAWRPCGDGRGDVAVLRLAAPVTLRAACFAPLNALDLPRSLAAVGFPVVADGLARIAAMEPTSSRFLIDGEWVQLHSSHDFGPAVGKGYSGSAVALKDSGEVVGMITAADKTDRLVHMLPVKRLLHHWPAMNRLLPLGPLDAAEHTTLRDALAAVPLPPAIQAARAVTDEYGGPEPEPGPLAAATSAYDIARYLAEDLYVDGVEPGRVRAVLARFCRRLAAGDAAATLPAWVRQHAPDHPGAAHRSSAPVPEPEPVTVTIQLARSGSGRGNVLLGIRLRCGNRQLAEVGHDVVPRGRVRSRVEELLPDVIARHIADGVEVAVEFVLPREWLSWPVDTWVLGRSSVVRIGWRHPVTVRDLARSQRSTADREHGRRWSQLCESAGEETVHWIGCQEPIEAGKLAATLTSQPERVVLALTAPPEAPGRYPALRAAFDTGMPAMLWRRETCSTHGDPNDPACAGGRFRAHLTERIGALAGLVELPELVRRLRTEAGEAGDDGGHHGRSVTLLWDPPGPSPAVPPLRMADAE